MKFTTISNILFLGLTGQALADPDALRISTADLAISQTLAALTSLLTTAGQNNGTRETLTSFKTSIKKSHTTLCAQPVVARDILLPAPDYTLDEELDIETFTVTKAWIPVPLTTGFITETYVVTKTRKHMQPTPNVLPIIVTAEMTSTVIELFVPDSPVVTSTRQPLNPEPTPQPEVQTEHHTTTLVSKVPVILPSPTEEAPPPPPPAPVTIPAAEASPTSTPFDFSNPRNGVSIMYNLEGLPHSYEHCFNLEEQQDVADDILHEEVWDKPAYLWCYNGPKDIGMGHKSLPAWIDAHITPCVRTLFGEPSKEDNEQLRNWIEWLCREDIYLEGDENTHW